MCQFTEGQIVKVLSYRGKPRNEVCRVAGVEEIRDTVIEPISWATRRRNSIARSRYLVTVEDQDQDQPVFRSFYDGFLEARRLSLWERLCRWFGRMFS